mmetsp:Transcript_2682/g.10927  ORF Transcript_2682/g.10927 Transcript_2682/m.10927 type:complete len:248 (-) Transcript_2682:2403-3146(-)
MRVPASAPSSRGNQTSANCASDRAVTEPPPPPPSDPKLPELPKLPKLPGPEPCPKSERNSATTCANVADAAGSAHDRTSSSTAPRDGSKPATSGDDSVHAPFPPAEEDLLAASTAAADHRAIASSTRVAQRAGVASSGVGVAAKNARRAKPTTSGWIPERSAAAPETWLASSARRTSARFSSVARAGGRRSPGRDAPWSNRQSTIARIGSGTSGGNDALRSARSGFPNVDGAYEALTVRKKSRPFSR